MLSLSEIRELSDYCLDEFQLLGKVKIEFEFSNRMSATIGRASTNIASKEALIKFSNKLFAIAPKREQEETVIHEVSHVITSILYSERSKLEGKAGHGPTWEFVHRKCGMEPNRFHCLGTFTTRLRVRCGGCSKEYRITKTLYSRRLNESRRRGFGEFLGRCDCGNLIHHSHLILE